MSERLNRRDFLTYGGAALAGVTLGEWGRRQLARADERVGASQDHPGAERWAATVCRECSAACGVRARLLDGIPVKLEGNPLCPIARGRLCAKGQAALEAYFDPDRLVGPARRVGNRGENRWKPIAWAEAIQLLAAHLRGGDADPRRRALAIAAAEHGPIATAWEQFWRAAGAHTAWTSAPTVDRLRPPFRALTGLDAVPLFDLEHASHVLSFGAPLAETWLSPVWAQRSYGRFRRTASRPRGRLVQVECRRSITAGKADEWLPVETGNHVLLAYGIASVLLREDRIAHEFLREHKGNLDAFARDVTARYAPNAVAALTGVPVVTILRLARDLAAAPAPLIVAPPDADAALVDAVLALNALVGAFERPGGILASPAPAVWIQEDARAALGSVVAGSYRPRVIALRDASALRTLELAPDLGRALDAVDLVVSFSPYLDEAAAVADLLLPASTALESWHALLPAPAVPLEATAVAAPAVPSRLDTRDVSSTLHAVGQLLGGPAQSACPWKTDADVVADAIEKLGKERRGGPYADNYETDWLRQLERGGWWTPAATSPAAFRSAVLDAGGWMDPFFATGAIVQALGARGGFTFRAPAAIAPLAGVPALQRAGGSTLQLPLRLVAFTPASVNLAGSPNQPALYELLGQPDGLPWCTWAEMSRETAHAMNLDESARVRIESVSGSVVARIVLVDQMPADLVALAFVPSGRAAGRFARAIAGDARQLWPTCEVTGSCAVRVVRA
jgi:anaerobic selenocysteine-containing dehydrogenase